MNLSLDQWSIVFKTLTIDNALMIGVRNDWNLSLLRPCMPFLEIYLPASFREILSVSHLRRLFASCTWLKRNGIERTDIDNAVAYAPIHSANCHWWKNSYKKLPHESYKNEIRGKSRKTELRPRFRGVAVYAAPQLFANLVTLLGVRFRLECEYLHRLLL